MPTPDPDERFAIEGDPEETLRGLLGVEGQGQQREYEVLMTEDKREKDVSGQPIDDEDYIRTKVWRGPAANDEAAHDTAWAAWRYDFGEPTGPTTTRVHPL
jgi:hypothetical protein